MTITLTFDDADDLAHALHGAYENAGGDIDRMALYLAKVAELLAASPIPPVAQAHPSVNPAQSAGESGPPLAPASVDADRELLEAAAKAAGMSGKYPFEGDTVTWNPLAYDGDALRLAVKLDIEVYQGEDEGRAAYALYWGKPERRDVTRMACIEYHHDLLNAGDPYAATRRAIVRAAAELANSTTATPAQVVTLSGATGTDEQEGAAK